MAVGPCCIGQQIAAFALPVHIVCELAITIEIDNYYMFASQASHQHNRSALDGLDSEGVFPDMARLGTHLLVSFEAVKLRHPKLVWINYRWFLENGIDVLAPGRASEIEQWLMERFAYVIPCPEVCGKTNDSETKTFFADRYGGEGISSNGGSGRVGISGNFQIKGIGRTPLASDRTHISHQNGALYLTEALRDVVYSEIFCAEAPHGGVPTIAVIDSGIDFEGEINGNIVTDKRALLIRPAFVRPAHCERAIMFRPNPTDHEFDALRVRQCVNAFLSQWRGKEAGPAQFSLESFFNNIGEQLAFSHVHRLSIGAFSTSNIAGDGAIADFGAATALQTWHSVRVVDTAPRFGAELHSVQRAIPSLVFYFRKYGGAKCLQFDEQTLLQILMSAYSRAFRCQALSLFGLRDLPDCELEINRFLQSFAEYIANCQAYRYHIEDERQQFAELHKVFCSEPAIISENGPSRERELYMSVQRLYELKAAKEFSRPMGMDIPRRMLMPRHVIVRPVLHRTLENSVRKACGESGAIEDSIQNTILSLVSISRRIWLELPAGMSLRGQVSWGYCSALYSHSGATSARCLVLSGVIQGGSMHCFGVLVAFEAVVRESVSKWGSVTVPVCDEYEGEEITVALNDILVQIPRMELLYC